MDAVYSGQAGVIAFIEGAEARVRDANSLEIEMTIGREGVGYLFAGCRDIVLVKGIRQNEVIG